MTTTFADYEVTTLDDLLGVGSDVAEDCTTNSVVAFLCGLVFGVGVMLLMMW